jgi:hypothetical protein
MFWMNDLPPNDPTVESQHEMLSTVVPLTPRRVSANARRSYRDRFKSAVATEGKAIGPVGDPVLAVERDALVRT